MNQTSTRMEIGSSDEQIAVIQNILSSNMYSRPDVAAVREYLANGLDATRAAGLDPAEHPVHIRLPRADNGWTLEVADEGTGMDEETLLETFTLFGGSGKRGNSSATGELGIGAKAGFAVSDQITVTTTKDGTTHVLVISSGTDGLKTKQLAASVDTGRPNGTRIEMKIRPDRRHPDHWAAAGLAAVAWVPDSHFTITPSLMGYQVGYAEEQNLEPGTTRNLYDHRSERAPSMKETMLVYLGEGLWYPLSGKGRHVVMNHIAYEIPDSWRTDYRGPLYIEAPNKSLQVSPNRESLTNTPQNQAWVKGQISRARELFELLLNRLLDQWFQTLATDPQAEHHTLIEMVYGWGLPFYEPKPLFTEDDAHAMIRTRENGDPYYSSAYFSNRKLTPLPTRYGLAVVEDCVDLDNSEVKRATLAWVRRDQHEIAQRIGVSDLAGLETRPRKYGGRYPDSTEYGLIVLFAPGGAPGWSARDPRVSRISAEEVLQIAQEEKDARAKERAEKLKSGNIQTGILSREMTFYSQQTPIRTLTGTELSEDQELMEKLRSKKAVFLLTEANFKKLYNYNPVPFLFTSPSVRSVIVHPQAQRYARRLEDQGVQTIVLNGASNQAVNTIHELETKVICEAMGVPEYKISTQGVPYLITLLCLEEAVGPYPQLDTPALNQLARAREVLDTSAPATSYMNPVLALDNEVMLALQADPATFEVIHTLTFNGTHMLPQIRATALGGKPLLTDEQARSLRTLHERVGQALSA